MSSAGKKERLDTLLVSAGLAATRQKARALVMAGAVSVDSEQIDKPGKLVDRDANIQVKQESPYVGRGGNKLEPALDFFGIDPSGLKLLDAGASTGGFTDCLLQRGAARVIAVDVGYGQLDWRLRSDERVTVMERTNIRFLEPAALPYPVDAAVADLSFISLELILPVLSRFIPHGGWLLVLVKPQFEVGRGDVGKGGVVRDEAKIRAAVDRIKTHAVQSGFLVRGEFPCTLKGPKGNQEYFLHLATPKLEDRPVPVTD
jgi:23S rRNA (cytidine1920-2'-O)/16S rRNA (cytidine1409-2'-O)-methyltransferase